MKRQRPVCAQDSAPPPRTPDLEKSFFCHAMKVPGHELIRGQWDLRGGLDDYLEILDELRPRPLQGAKRVPRD